MVTLSSSPVKFYQKVASTGIALCIFVTLEATSCGYHVLGASGSKTCEAAAYTLFMMVPFLLGLAFCAWHLSTGIDTAMRLSFNDLNRENVAAAVSMNGIVVKSYPRITKILLVIISMIALIFIGIVLSSCPKAGKCRSAEVAANEAGKPGVVKTTTRILHIDQAKYNTDISISNEYGITIIADLDYIMERDQMMEKDEMEKGDLIPEDWDLDWDEFEPSSIGEMYQKEGYFGILSILYTSIKKYARRALEMYVDCMIYLAKGEVIYNGDIEEVQRRRRLQGWEGKEELQKGWKEYDLKVENMSEIEYRALAAATSLTPADDVCAEPAFLYVLPACTFPGSGNLSLFDSAFIAFTLISTIMGGKASKKQAIPPPHLWIPGGGPLSKSCRKIDALGPP